MEHTSLLRSISSKGPVMIFRRALGGGENFGRDHVVIRRNGEGIGRQH